VASVADKQTVGVLLTVVVCGVLDRRGTAGVCRGCRRKPHLHGRLQGNAAGD